VNYYRQVLYSAGKRRLFADIEMVAGHEEMPARLGAASFDGPGVAEPGIDIGNKTSDRGGGPTGPRIRCPKCKWEPREGDKWGCTCGHTWNTFDTGGVCPGCMRQWKITQCLQCHEYSAHSDWYGED
jgi:hypothetical protein